MLAWPRKSFWRSFRYYAKRALRLTATPHAIAAGVAAGAFASFLPYMGFHFVIAAVLAWVLRGNLIASAIGTAVGNPLTFPFIWAATLGFGRFILYGRHPGEIAPLHLGRALSHFDFEQIWQPLLLPMTIGGTLLGALTALILYLVTRSATAAFAERRRARLARTAGRAASAARA